MQNTTERWRELCVQAAKEKDTDHLLELVREIDRMLYEREAHFGRRKERHDVQNIKGTAE